MKREKMEILAEVVPSFWLVPLINGDYTGDITEEEEKEIQAFISWAIEEGYHITCPMGPETPFFGTSIWAEKAGDMSVIGLVR